jgi:hypothetical protein
MFDRPHHQRIHRLLGAMNVQFLTEAQCFFGGGTAIVLLLGEYRESVDVDFLCASPEGYRLLRNAVSSNSLGPLFAQAVVLAREVRADRYGIRTFVEVDGQAVKFEIVYEARIAVQGSVLPSLGVPTLSRADMMAEKLLANADRYLDKSQLLRDAIDLAMMVDAWGDIPAVAWEKTRASYGASIDKALRGAIVLANDRIYLGTCLQKMHMDMTLVDRIPAVLSRLI